MLAKPEYFSPPDEVCCWPGALRRRAIGKILPAGGAAAESHREDVAGRGRCGMDGAKRKSERKSLPLRRRRCNAAGAQKTLQCSRCTEAAAMQQMRRRRCNAAGAQKPLRCSRCTEDVAMQQMRRRRSDGRQKEKASKHRSLAQKKQPGTEACDPNAGCARKITIRVNILLTLRPATREATTCGAAHHPRSNNLRSGPSPAKQPPAEQPANREATNCGAARRRHGAKRYLKKSSSRYLGSGQSSSSIIISNLSALRRIFSIYGKTVLL